MYVHLYMSMCLYMLYVYIHNIYIFIYIKYLQRKLNPNPDKPPQQSTQQTKTLPTVNKQYLNKPEPQAHNPEP